MMAFCFSVLVIYFEIKTVNLQLIIIVCLIYGGMMLASHPESFSSMKYTGHIVDVVRREVFDG